MKKIGFFFLRTDIFILHIYGCSSFTPATSIIIPESFYPRCCHVLFLLVQIVFDFTEVKVFAGAAAESVEDVEAGRLEV